MTNKKIYNSIRGNVADQTNSLQVSNWKKNCSDAVGWGRIGKNREEFNLPQIWSVMFLVEAEITSVK